MWGAHYETQGRHARQVREGFVHWEGARLFSYRTRPSILTISEAGSLYIADSKANPDTRIITTWSGCTLNLGKEILELREKSEEELFDVESMSFGAYLDRFHGRTPLDRLVARANLLPENGKTAKWFQRIYGLKPAAQVTLYTYENLGTLKDNGRAQELLVRAWQQ